MSNIDIVVASEGCYEESIFRKGYSNLPRILTYNLRFFENNKKPLAQLYNECIENTNAELIVFCHDDISIEDSMFEEKLYSAIGEDSEYSICGLAGNAKMRVCKRNLWHIMGDRDTHSGAVAHYTGKDDTECFMTHFGRTPRRCILLDGLFLAINVKDIREVGLRFDEECPSRYHFYDLNFCMEANKLGLKMTTWPIWVVHESHGLSDIDNDEWCAGNKYFIEKWGKK